MAPDGARRAGWGHPEIDRQAVEDGPLPPRFVYFIQAPNGLIKIGVAESGASRLRGLRAQNATPLRLIAHVEGGLAEERALHVKLAAFRAHGEWFRPTPEVLRAAHFARRRQDGFVAAQRKFLGLLVALIPLHRVRIKANHADEIRWNEARLAGHEDATVYYVHRINARNAEVGL